MSSNPATSVSDVQPDGFFTRGLAAADPAVFGGLQQEVAREKKQIELIASENIVSKAVLEAQGSVFTNKYAEGYPGKRYYQGCHPSDIVEQLAIDRAKAMFNCGFANVQPHSGAQANGAVMLALTKPGDTIMGLSLDAGGHLTHGAKAALSGKWYNAVQYGVRPDDHRIDFDQVEALAREHRPTLIITGGSAYPRHIDFARFRAIADEVGALFMVDMAHFAGLVAGGVHPTPFGHAHVVTTTTHKTLRGPRGGMILTDDEAIAKKINSAVFPGLQGGPLMHVIAAKAVAFGEALEPGFKSYAAAITCISGPPWRPGNTAELIFFAITSSSVRIIPPRGPRSVLCVVVVTTWAWPNGVGWTPPATSPAKWAMSTMNIAPTSSAIARKRAKSIWRG